MLKETTISDFSKLFKHKYIRPMDRCLLISIEQFFIPTDTKAGLLFKKFTLF